MDQHVCNDLCKSFDLLDVQEIRDAQLANQRRKEKLADKDDAFSGEDEDEEADENRLSQVPDLNVVN